MPSVLSAVKTWWDATAAAQALTADGKLWLAPAPEDTPLPYATFFLVSQPIETWTTGYPLKRASVQVNLHAATAVEASGMAGALENLLGKALGQSSGAALVVGGSAVIHVLQDDFLLQQGEGLGPLGSDCWVAIVTFDIPFTS